MPTTHKKPIEHTVRSHKRKSATKTTVVRQHRRGSGTRKIDVKKTGISIIKSAFNNHAEYIYLTKFEDIEIGGTYLVDMPSDDDSALRGENMKFLITVIAKDEDNNNEIAFRSKERVKGGGIDENDIVRGDEFNSYDNVEKFYSKTKAAQNPKNRNWTRYSSSEWDSKKDRLIETMGNWKQKHPGWETKIVKEVDLRDKPGQQISWTFQYRKAK